MHTGIAVLRRLAQVTLLRAMMILDVPKIKAVLKKAAAVNSKPTEETFPELPTVVVWLRFFLAAAYGTFLGINGAKGGYMVVQILNLIAFIPVMYCRLYLGTDSEAFGSQLLFVGLMPALALTMLIWIYFFTALHEESGGKLASLLILPITPLDGISYDAAGDTPAVEDSEF